MIYTTLRERMVKRARRVRMLQQFVVGGALVGFWIVVVRVLFY